ncbi:MAG: J domain-containing protein [Betaproteobacteria bacterium AqS2]|uniref:J domain-containing protein n=1 Tax=Candidatus Amphirhobacter heronislandensis TaxID=1732024 RepID=A0A930Y2I8_9GAMM|nr:J domain-containing protein [Betaproteobacteria bacterium AqS2]
MRIKPGNSPFEVLGVDLHCSDDEVRKAYRRLAMKLHPDRNPSGGAEEEFKRVQASYQLLKSENSRARVRDIVTLYSAYAAAAEPGGKYAGPQTAEEFHAAAASFRNKRPRALWMEFKLAAVIALRLERMPLKMFVYVPFLLVCYNFLHPAGIEPPTVLRALWQGALAAFATDTIVEMARETTRYTLRSRVNNFVLLGLLGAMAIGILTSFGVIKADEEYMYALSLLLSVVAVYAWVVFCFMFQKYDPLWEPLLVWVGVGGVLYTMQFVL